MSTDVTVLRVFTDATGEFGNPLGVVDAATVTAGDHQSIATHLGYSETIFVDLPEPGAPGASLRIYTPTTELPFAGHPTVGAAWWLRERGYDVSALLTPAGRIEIALDGDRTVVRARPEWCPAFRLHRLDAVEDVLAAAPADFPVDAEHYLWCWSDEARGEVRARMFAPSLGVPEDEATGSAAVRLSAHLGRDLAIVQGQGSQIGTVWHGDGSVGVGGRVRPDGTVALG